MTRRPGALWFTGPPSFTAQSARDRRCLLGYVDELRLRVAALESEQAEWLYQTEVDVANAERLPIVEAENAQLRENQK